MKKTISTLAVLFCMGIASQAAATPILTLTPDTQSFPVGEERSVTVGVTLDAGESLDESALFLDFNDTVLDFVSLTWAADFTSDYILNEVYTPNTGHVGFSATWNGGIDKFNIFDIATLTFSGASAGTSLLELTGSIYTYDWGADLYPFYDNLSASAAMAPVPEPATLLLLGTGLAGLCGFRRKSRKQDQAA